jgi:hypothetical protein
MVTVVAVAQVGSVQTEAALLVVMVVMALRRLFLARL